MSGHIEQQQTWARISELVTLRDDVQAAERTFAGKANALGFAMRVPERNRKYLNVVEWVKASLSPISLLTKSFTTVLERLRSSKTTTRTAKKLQKITEQVVFWGGVLNGLTKAMTATTPCGAVLAVANVEASLLLKAMKLRKLDRIEALETAMDYYWNASLEFRRLCPAVVVELNSEIDQSR